MRPPGSCTVAAVGELELIVIEPSLPIGEGIWYMHEAHCPPRNLSSAAYGPNVRRLQSIKAKYDPENVFHLNLNITPRT